MAHKILPSQDYLRQCLDYDPETGLLYWIERPASHFRSHQAWTSWNTRFSGKEAGSFTDHGYRQIALGGIVHNAHRIIWKWMTDEQPNEIDHEDTNGCNNRWTNLRPATRQQQLANSHARNTIECKGVRQRPAGNFSARIKVNRIEIHLGCFPTMEEAKAAYDTAARKHFREFARS